MAKKYSTIVSIVYAVIYGLVFIATSIYSFIQTATQLMWEPANDKNKEKESNTKQIELNIVQKEEEATAAMPSLESIEKNEKNVPETMETKTLYPSDNTKQETDAKYEEAPPPNESANGTASPTKITQSQKSDAKSFTCLSFFKAWFKNLWRKKKIYWSIMPHIADQATDFGVLLTYYNEWMDYDNNSNAAVDPFWLFWISLFIIFMQKTVSSLTMFVLTQSVQNAVLQFFDLLLLKAVYVNYLCGLDEPGNPQRYIELLEAVFESAPQILLSMGYILKKAGGGEQIEAIIIVSTIFSLWSLTSKVASDDKVLFKEYERDKKPFINLDIAFQKKLCFVRFNWQYLMRVILWRFFEIAARICLLVLIWVNIGGLSVTIILCIEFFVCFAFCIAEKAPDLMGNLMFISFAFTKGYVRWFYWYRIISFYLFLISVTIFASLDFEASKVPKHEERHEITINNTFGIFILCFTWIAAIISHIVLRYLVSEDIIDDYTFKLSGTMDSGDSSSTSRSIFSYLASTQLKEVKQLILFGVTAKDTFVDSGGRTILHHAWRIYDDMDLFNAVATANQQHINTKDRDGNTPLHEAANCGNIDAVKWLVEHNANLNEKDSIEQTPMIVAAKDNYSKSVDVIKYLLRNGAETHHKDEDGKSLLDVCKAKDATKYKEIILMLENDKKQ